MSAPNKKSQRASTFARPENQYVREILHAPEPAPPITVRFFYTSPLAIDDPLSPLPPPVTGSGNLSKAPPRAFSEYDNRQLETAWLSLRKRLLKYNEEQGGEKNNGEQPRLSFESQSQSGSDAGPPEPRRRGFTVPGTREDAARGGQSSRSYGSYEDRGGGNTREFSSQGALSASLRTLDPADLDMLIDRGSTTGTPFVRAPSRRNVPRPLSHAHTDSYDWDTAPNVNMSPRSGPRRENKSKPTKRKPAGPSAKVPVGISRLHEVVMPELQMEPIYWSPLNDVAPVVRGTWFYKDTMLPVETDIANLLEAGYISLQPWTETWRDELNSAIEVGALGEMKVAHTLWPEKSKKKPADSRPGTSRGELLSSISEESENSPERERDELVEHARDMIDISNGSEGADNKASGTSLFGRDGQKRLYLNSQVIFADEKEAYILRPNLQPSAYYGRRPLANYIRKGRKIGIQVVRGFDQDIWDRIYPPKKGAKFEKAREGVSSSMGGVHPGHRMKLDAALSQSDRPVVTDLVLVIHGIGQKLSERVESFHFTHAINSFRREVNVELGSDSVRGHLRKDLGGIMVLPVNWRLSLSFEDGGYRDDNVEDSAQNPFKLKDITPDTLPSVRNIISDVMLDIPYYLSVEHHSKMVAACIREANRIYRLWCKNNPGFAEWGRVHILAHSLGSVMALDILSHQPTYVDKAFGDPKTPEQDLPTDHFLFDTTDLFLCGSPAGFFLLLKKGALRPRHDRKKPGGPAHFSPGVAGDKDTYGCVAVDNVYNIVNPYDPVAYRLNATVDADYAATLKPALVPSANTSWFNLSNPFRNPLAGADASVVPFRASVLRLPSNVELETHNFSREEIAEERAYALNDNGQIDWFLKYGGGPLEIQYLTMLGAHSSYWISRDFVRMLVMEVGRPFGREGTALPMRAAKRKDRSS